MRNIIIILASIIFLAMLGIIIWLLISKANVVKDNDDLKLKYSILSQKWNKLISTPPIVRTITHEVTASHEVVEHPKPSSTIYEKNPSVDSAKKDTTAKKIKETYYNQTSSIGDTIHVHWRAHVFGSIDWINFDRISYPARTTTIQTMVPADPCDTITILRKYCKEKNTLWLSVQPQLVLPLKLVSLSLGVDWMVKKKWGVGAGAGYDWNTNQPILNGRIYFNLH